MAFAGLVRWLAGKVMRLPPRRTGQVQVEKDLPAPMRDGVVLRADRYFARERPSAPVVLIRSPYGRGGLFGMMGALLAERGFQAVVQSVRGTGGSDGQLEPMVQERADGADTVDWVRAQPWFTGKLFTFGASYLGNAQWATAMDAGDKIDGLALAMTLSNFRDELLGFGGFTQAGTLGWTQTMQLMVDFVPGRKMKRPEAGALDQVHGLLPVGALDKAAFGKTVSWWQDWVSHDDPQDPWWDAMDYSAAVTALDAPAAMVAGWQDIFLPFQLKDFEARRAAGREAWLTIGPWSHSAAGGMFEGLRQAVTFLSDLDAGRAPFPKRDRVRLYLQGAKAWRDYPSWPPPGGQPLRLYLRAGGRLEGAPPDREEGATGYTYDPSDPTPAVHGPMVMSGSKVRDMTALEKRNDAIQFTGTPLERAVDVIGPVTVELAVRSDREHTDFYACLCDVDKRGRPIQVSDGYIRLRPGRPEADESGIRRITIECWPTAYRFRRGHKMRLMIASGAHPRYARNPGTGEPLATATRMVRAQQEIAHTVHAVSSVSMAEAPRRQGPDSLGQ